MKAQKKSKSRGFTLIELLAVIAIIGILSAILIPVVKSVRAKAHKTTAASNIRQQLTIWSLYSAENDDKLMPGVNRGPDTYLEWWWVAIMQRYDDSINQGQRRYGVLVSPVRGPLDGNHSWLGINQRICSTPTRTYRFSEIQNPARTVVFADSIVDIYHDNWSGANYTTYRYDDNTTSLFGFADGHVESAVTRHLSMPEGMFGSAFRPTQFSYTVSGE